MVEPEKIVRLARELYWDYGRKLEAIDVLRKTFSVNSGQILLIFVGSAYINSNKELVIRDDEKFIASHAHGIANFNYVQAYKEITGEVPITETRYLQAPFRYPQATTTQEQAPTVKEVFFNSIGQIDLNKEKDEEKFLWEHTPL